MFAEVLIGSTPRFQATFDEEPDKVKCIILDGNKEIIEEHVLDPIANKDGDVWFYDYHIDGAHTCIYVSFEGEKAGVIVVGRVEIRCVWVKGRAL